MDAAVDHTQFNGGPGHAVDHTAGFVLGQGTAARLLDRSQAAGPISPHAGEHHPQGVRSGDGRCGAEQHIYCRPAVVNWRGLHQAHPVLILLDDHHVIVPRGNQADARQQRIIVGCFPHLHGTEAVDAFGHGLGKVGRDVLHDGNGRQIGWQGGQDVTQGLDAAS